MKNIILPVILLVWAGLASGCATVPETTSMHPFIVAVVQLQISEEIFASPAMYKAVIRSTMEEAFKNRTPDIIIFPEYTSAFIALFPYINSIIHAHSMEQALAEIQKESPEITSIHSLLMKQSKYVESTMQSIFGELATEYRTMIVAGSYFAADGRKLYSRLAVFNPDGMKIYTQNKVYLTPDEKDVIKLSPGSIEKAIGIRYKNRRLVFTINHDSYFPVWTRHFGKADLWIDIKAHTGTFEGEQEENFKHFMPERLETANISYGVTACLVGTFLDYGFEGKSSILRKQGTAKKITETIQATTQEVLVAELP